MSFGSLGLEQRINIILELQNAAAYIGRMTEAAAATARLSMSERALAAETKKANTSSLVQQQGMYTLRRYAFFATTAFIGVGAAVMGLGLKFYNTMQTGRVAFKGFLGSTQAANTELRKIYATAAETPFTFPALVIATRRLIPFTKNVGLTNKLIMSMANSLSAAGVITDAALTRQSMALSHMFTVGRLTGQLLYQMGRDNIPMQQALQAAYHTTGDVIRRDVAGGLISAQAAAKALIDYTTTHKGFANAAFAQSTRTLSGAFSTMKDLIGMSVGSSEGGIFDSITKSIRGIDLALIKTAKSGQKVTLTELITAIDKRLTPGTHAIINLFIFFKSALQTVVVEVGILAKAIQWFLIPFNKVGNLFGSSRFAAKLLGIALGTLVTWLILSRTASFLFAEGQAVAKFSTISFGKAVILSKNIIKGYQLMMAGELIPTIRKWAFASTVASGNMYTGFKRVFTNNGALAKLARLILGVGVAEDTLTASVAANTVAWYANPITWIVLVVVALTAGLVILYFKWKAFHNAVNDTFNFLVKNAPYVAIALAVLLGPIGAIIGGLLLIIKYFDQIKRFGKWLNGIFGSGSKPVNFSNSQGNNYFQKTTVPTNQFSYSGGLWNTPGLANGGTVTRSGLVMVGERGREVLNLPRGASVSPLDTSSLSGSLTVHVYPQNIYMDGKKVGEAVSVAYQDAGARA